MGSCSLWTVQVAFTSMEIITSEGGEDAGGGVGGHRDMKAMSSRLKQLREPPQNFQSIL